MPDIIDVAKLAGVSKSTVSRVLGNSGPVKQETRTKIENAMKELNYTPNYFAQGIKTGKTKTVAIILPDSTNLFYNELLVGIEDVLLKNGYMMLICNTQRDVNREMEYIKKLLKRNIDGLILSTYFDNDRNLNYYKKLSAKLPIVFMDNVFPDNNQISKVLSEGKESNRRVVKYLYDKGCRKIAYLRIHNISIINHRYEGYLLGLEDCNLKYDERYVYMDLNAELNKSNIEIGMEGAEYLMNQQEPPDAIIAAIDTIAIGAIRYLVNNGYKVPEEVKVVGYDNVELSWLTKPSLTTLSQPIYNIGSEAAKILVHKILIDNNYNQQIIYEPELIIREST